MDAAAVFTQAALVTLVSLSLLLLFRVGFSGRSLGIIGGIVCFCHVMLFARVVNVGDANGLMLDASAGNAMGFKLDSLAIWWYSCSYRNRHI